LRVELLAAATIHWSRDGWRTFQDTPTRDSGLGIHFADLDTAGLAAASEIVFTFYWPAEDRREGVVYRLAID
jgi:glucoamylase